MHQHLPIFHTEHCVFCRFLSDGNSYLDCGRPCESNSVHLRDGNGKDHLVLADEGCRNTVFNAQAQSGKPLPSGLCVSQGRTRRGATTVAFTAQGGTVCCLLRPLQLYTV